MLRAVFLSRPMGNDEAATYLYYVRKPPLYGLVSYTLPNNHIFHTLLVSASVLIFGNHPWAIRLPAFLAGVAMMPLSFVAGRRLHGEDAGLLTAAFVASSYVLIDYSTNARGYTLVAAIFLALLALQPAMCRGEDRAWRWFVILAAVGFFTIPTMLFPFGVVVIWLLFQEIDRVRLTRAVGLTFLLAAVAYLPALLWTGPHAFLANRFITSRPWSMWLALIRPATIDPTWLGWNRTLGLAGMALFAVFFVVGFVRDKTRLPLIAILWCTVLVVAARWIVFPRVWTFLIPIYWTTVAAGIVWVFRRRAAPAIALAACVAIGSSSLASWNDVHACGDCFPAAERVVVSLRGVKDDVIAHSPAPVILQYYAVLHDEGLRIDRPRASDRKQYIVVDTLAGQTLATVARAEAVPTDVVSRATVYERFPGAIVYSSAM